MSSSAITTQVAQLKIGSVQNQADSSSVYSNGVWSFKNSTALTSVTITDAGNVGVGVTPSSAPTGSLFVKRSISGVDTTPFVLYHNSTLNAEQTADTYINNGAASRYYQNAGAHIWQRAASGLAGNSVTWSDSMRIDASGNLLVGTTNGSASAGVGIKLISSTTVPQVAIVVNEAGTSAGLSLYNTNAGAYRFYVNNAGTIFATNTTISGISDNRFKENIEDLNVGLDAVLALKPRKFDWKDGKGKDIKGDRGFIAQEFEQVFPDLVDEWKDPSPEGEEPYKSVRADLIPVLVKAIQELSAKVDAQAAEIEALKAK